VALVVTPGSDRAAVEEWLDLDFQVEPAGFQARVILPWTKPFCGAMRLRRVFKNVVFGSGIGVAVVALSLTRGFTRCTTFLSSRPSSVS
jgi:hypothetical protein